MKEFSENDLKQMFVNPYYAININPKLVTEHEPMVSEETWVNANANVINEIGVQEWLRLLLQELKSDQIPKELPEE